MFKKLTFYLVLLLVLPGCASFLEYVERNPNTSSMLFNQATALFIQSKPAGEERVKRAKDTVRSVELIEAAVETSVIASAAELVPIVSSKIDIKDLEISQQIFIEDLLKFVAGYMAEQEALGKIPKGSTVPLKVILSSMKSTANRFLLQ